MVKLVSLYVILPNVSLQETIHVKWGLTDLAKDTGIKGLE